MKLTPEKLVDIEMKLDSFKTFIQENVISQLNGSFNKLYGSFHKFYSTLTSENILSVDPYGEDHNLENLDLPDLTPIPYNEEEYTISIRLTHYNTLITYIKTENLLFLDKLNIPRTRNLEKLLYYIHWDHLFDPQPVDVNTEALNKVLLTFQNETSQQFIITSIKASVVDIENYRKEILKFLEPITLLNNEQYKLWIRKEILPGIKLPPELKGENIKKAHDSLTKLITQSKKPLFIELIGEVLKEDFTEEGILVRDETLLKINEFMDPTEEKETAKKIKKPIEVLEQSLNELFEIITQKESLITKTNNNTSLVKEETYSFIEKIIEYLKTNLLGSKPKTVFMIQVKDGQEDKNREIEVENLIQRFEVYCSRLLDLKNNEGNNFESLVIQGEEEVAKKIHRLISSARHYYKLFLGLDRYFKEKLTSVKGIQIELKVLLSVIDKSQATYYEYKQLIDDRTNTNYKPDISQAT